MGANDSESSVPEWFWPAAVVCVLVFVFGILPRELERPGFRRMLNLPPLDQPEAATPTSTIYELGRVQATRYGPPDHVRRLELYANEELPETYRLIPDKQTPPDPGFVDGRFIRVTAPPEVVLLIRDMDADSVKDPGAAFDAVPAGIRESMPFEAAHEYGPQRIRVVGNYNWRTPHEVVVEVWRGRYQECMNGNQLTPEDIYGAGVCPRCSADQHARGH